MLLNGTKDDGMELKYPERLTQIPRVKTSSILSLLLHWFETR